MKPEKLIFIVFFIEGPYAIYSCRSLSYCFIFYRFDKYYFIGLGNEKTKNH